MSSFLSFLVSPSRNSAIHCNWRQLVPCTPLSECSIKTVMPMQNVDVVKAHVRVSPEQYAPGNSYTITYECMKYYDHKVYQFLIQNHYIALDRILADLAAAFNRGELVKSLYYKHGLKCHNCIAEALTYRGHRKLQIELHRLYGFPFPVEYEEPPPSSHSGSLIQLCVRGASVMLFHVDSFPFEKAWGFCTAPEIPAKTKEHATYQRPKKYYHQHQRQPKNRKCHSCFRGR